MPADAGSGIYFTRRFVQPSAVLARFALCHGGTIHARSLPFSYLYYAFRTTAYAIPFKLNLCYHSFADGVVLRRYLCVLCYAFRAVVLRRAFNASYVTSSSAMATPVRTVAHMLVTKPTRTAARCFAAAARRGLISAVSGPIALFNAATYILAPAWITRRLRACRRLHAYRITAIFTEPVVRSIMA